MSFVPHPDFDAGSYRAECPVTGLPKQSDELGRQPHEVDEFIFRGPDLVFYDGRGEASLGHFDVRAQAIYEAARDHLGMVPGDEFGEVLEANEVLGRAIVTAEAEIEALEEQIDALYELLDARDEADDDASRE